DNVTGELLGAADVVDGNDMRVVEMGDGAGFRQVRFGVRPLSDESGVRHLDGHGPAELVVVSQVNPSETAFAQQPVHAVAADVRGECGSRGDGRLLLWAGRERIKLLVHGRLQPPGAGSESRVWGWRSPLSSSATARQPPYRAGQRPSTMPPRRLRAGRLAP